MKTALEQLNTLLAAVATTIVTATTIIGATAALLRKVRRLLGHGRGPRS